MNILLVHQNFPGQFKFLAPALAARHRVVAMTMNKFEPQKGLDVVMHRPSRGTSKHIHPWVSDLETKIIRGESGLRAALRMREQGFRPDVILAHPGWGESLFLKDVWPQARLAIYCEFFYHATGLDVDFDPGFPAHADDTAPKLRIKNACQVLHFDQADAGLAPTLWQASTYPDSFRPRISVIHDGIDTDAIRPEPERQLALKGMTLTRKDEVITFVNRNLEPYRGFHTFMRALPVLLRQRPHAQILIVGADGRGYGAVPDDGRSWKETYVSEVRPQISDADWERVHFLGNVPYRSFVAMLQVSSVHVYLTYPFVLSWSLLEAMSAGCAIIGSDTAPVREAITHDETGRLVNFFDHEALAAEIARLLDHPEERQRLGQRAREFACQTYDLKRICLPRQLEFVEALATGGWIGDPTARPRL